MADCKEKCTCMMQDVMKNCKKCPYVPLVIGVVALLIGLFFDGTLIRIVWILLSIAIVALAVYVLLTDKKENQKKE